MRSREYGPVEDMGAGTWLVVQEMKERSGGTTESSASALD